MVEMEMERLKLWKFVSEIAEVVLAHCNIVNKDYQQDLIILYTFIPNKSLGQLLGFSRKMYFFKKPLIHNFLYWSMVPWTTF